MWWVDHGVELSEVRRMTMLERARLRAVFTAKDHAAAERSPQRQAEHEARLADAKRKAGQL